LEGDPLGCEVEPTLEEAVIREETAERPVDRCDVLRISRENRPPERPNPAAEERPDIGRDKARV
jgi:hypothetical protein